MSFRAIQSILIRITDTLHYLLRLCQFKNFQPYVLDFPNLNFRTQTPFIYILFINLIL
jgi:hypothetical protein